MMLFPVLLIVVELIGYALNRLQHNIIEGQFIPVLPEFYDPCSMTNKFVFPHKL